MNVFKLPDVGEGLVEAEIAAWQVKPGDSVKVNDVLVEIETAKSIVELPSPYEGTVAELLVPAGETVAVGTPIIRFAGDDSTPEPVPAPTTAAVDAEPEASGNVLVGYGISTAPASTSVSLKRTTAQPAAEPQHDAVSIAQQVSTERVRSTPPVRAFAKQQGIDLQSVSGSGPHGRVLRSDVEAYLTGANVEASAPVELVASASSVQPGVREERYPFKGVRKAIAQAMVKSYTEIPHATVTTEFDMTATMEFIAELKKRPEHEGRKFTPVLFAAKALIRSIARNPQMNTAIDGDEIVQRHYVNLGIAAATPRGLIVPNIKNAHEMSLLELESALAQLVATAREGKTTPADQAGGTITISNAGLFGLDIGTPIINPGEHAILGLGAIREKPWVVNGEIVPRKISNIVVSIDHRILDGEVAGRFLSDIAEALADPRMLLLS